MIDVLQLSQYTPEDYREYKSQNVDWVQYGVDNDFPDYLVDLRYTSAVHGALCESIAQILMGDGLELSKPELLNSLKIDDAMYRGWIDFKIQGGFYWEIIVNGEGEIAEINHLPFEKVRSGKYIDGNIQEYYYCDKGWAKNTRKKDVSAIPVWKPEVGFGRYIYPVIPSQVGCDYYPKPDYLGAMYWIELDKNIALFHASNIKNGLAPSFFIHFKNGTPTAEERDELQMYIEGKLQGAGNAGKWVATFSDSGAGEQAPDMEVIPTSDLDKQYQFLSEECTNKIMIGHRVTSPSLFGVKTAGQLSGASEMKEAMDIFMERIVMPTRQVVISLLKPLFDYLGSSIDIIDVEDTEVIMDANTVNGVIGVLNGALSEEQKRVILKDLMGVPEDTVGRLLPLIDGRPELFLSDLSELDKFIGEGEDEDLEEWELIDERRADDVARLKDSVFMARVPSSNPNGKSEQDTPVFKVRYQYAPLTTQANSREFCRKMVAARKVYRYEDIQAASDRPVNPGWGPGGTNTYDLWLYKGGGDCHHYWMRKVYLKKNNKKISVNEARRILNDMDVEERDKNRLPVNDPKVAQLPKDMPNRGFLKPRR